jgi:hypothetical protein
LLKFSSIRKRALYERLPGFQFSIQSWHVADSYNLATFTKNGRSTSGRKSLQTLVGAAGFEPATPAQGSARDSRKAHHFFLARKRALVALCGWLEAGGAGCSYKFATAKPRSGLVQSAKSWRCDDQRQDSSPSPVRIRDTVVSSARQVMPGVKYAF